jgi:MFS family permease
MNTGTDKFSIYPVLAVNFIGSLGYSLILPFLVFLVSKFGGNEFIYGLLGCMYPLFQFFGAPILGKWSDTFGRKRILFLSQAGTLLAWGLFLWALLVPNGELVQVESGTLGTFLITLPLVMLFLARALDGLTGGNISVANAYMADISDDSNRKQNFGKMAMSASFGFILGPVIAGLLGSTALEELLPVLAAMLISLIALVLIWKFLPESKPCVIKPDLKNFKIKKIFDFEHRECYDPEDNDKRSSRSVFSIKYVPFLIVYYFLVFLGFSFYYASFPIHAMQKLEWTSFDLGIYFSILSGLMIMVQGPVLSSLSKKLDEPALILIGSFLLGVNFLLISTDSVYLIYVAAVFFAAGNGIMWPSFLSILSKVGGKHKQGAVQGTANSAGSLASIFGLLFGGFLYGIVGSMTFTIASVVLFLIFLVSFKLISVNRNLAVESA